MIDRGSLAEAMRATMSLPGVFPPVEAGSRVLVDGGALDNVPADVVRAMGAAFVIAIDVGNAPDDAIDYSMFGLLGRHRRRDDARQHAPGAPVRRPDHRGRRARVRIARLAAQRRADRARLQGRRAARGPSCCPWRSTTRRGRAWIDGRQQRRRGQRGRSPHTSRRPASSPRDAAADQAAAGASRRTAAQHRQSREGPGRVVRSRSLPGAHLAARPKTGDKPACDGARSTEGVWPAVPDARPEPREHDVERFPRRGSPRAISRSTCSAPARSCGSTARSAPTRTPPSRCTGRCSGRVCSSGRLPG